MSTALRPGPDQALPAGRPAREGAHRLVFANQLRGLAALLVALSHLIGVFWLDRAVVDWATAAPAQSGEPPGLVALVAQPWFMPGPFGVGLFFLISGLVIPISLERHSRGSFVLARLLRIYPTYLAALAVNLAVVWWAHHHWGTPFPHRPLLMLSNALLVQDLLQLPGLDLVNWTLLVELKFYALMALLAGPVRRGSVAALVWLALALLGANLATGALDAALAGGSPRGAFLAHRLALIVQGATPFLVFMLIGVLFRDRLLGRLSVPGFLAAAAGLGAIFVACWRTAGPTAALPPWMVAQYGLAFLLFGGLFLLRGRIPAFAPLDALAAVSFPFYLLHSVVGYSLLRLLMVGHGWGYGPALGVTLPAVLVLATALHLSVEKWSIAAGRRLSARAATVRSG